MGVEFRRDAQAGYINLKAISIVIIKYGPKEDVPGNKCIEEKRKQVLYHLQVEDMWNHRL